MVQKRKGSSPTVSKGEKPQCHIHDNVKDDEVDDVRQSVCVNKLALAEHTDGKHYCLFHLPTTEKDIEKFLEIFNARLESADTEVSKTDDLPDGKLEVALGELSGNFKYVWFPCAVYLKNQVFESYADFRGATFSALADFRKVTFSGSAYFNSAAFFADADFSNATFYIYASFNEAAFSADVDFRKATFSASADFRNAIFSAYAYFNSADFFADADFGSAKFLETSQIFFRKTSFQNLVDFNYSIFSGYAAFEGFGDKRVFIEEGGGNTGAVLNMQNARLENPERFSFHRVRLRPSWFVNIDSRKMVFTDITWENLDSTYNNSNVTTEIENLDNREISGPSRLLEIACRQLAANAEENNRYEEASKFRYMAMETKRLEYRWQGRFWTLNWWYRLSSGYGEDWKRAVVVLIGVLVLFGVLYASPLSRFDFGEKKDTAAVEQPIAEKTNDPERFQHPGLSEGAVHSLYVSALQRPEPKAGDTLTKFFVILETILGPLQAALLALAIRRKFMR
jgi:uncharacterized protein YjbI with pentapeptide repeats